MSKHLIILGLVILLVTPLLTEGNEDQMNEQDDFNTEDKENDETDEYDYLNDEDEDKEENEMNENDDFDDESEEKKDEMDEHNDYDNEDRQENEINEHHEHEEEEEEGNDEYITKGQFVETDGKKKYCKSHRACYDQREPQSWCILKNGQSWTNKGCFCDEKMNSCIIERKNNGKLEYSYCTAQEGWQCSYD